MRISDWSSDVCSSDLPQTFQPTIDVDYSAVKIEMPPGTPLDDTAAVASRAAGLLAEQPEVMTVFQDIGSDGADVRMAMLYLRLKPGADRERTRSEEHTSELQSLMRISYAVFCLKKKKNRKHK